MTGQLVDLHPHYGVQALRLDHRIASLAYSLQERFHININKDRLDGSACRWAPGCVISKMPLWDGQAR